MLKHKSFTIPIKSHWCCYSSSNVHPVKIQAKTCRQQGALFINQVYLLRGPVCGILRKLSAEMKFNIHNTGMFSLVQSGKSLFSLPLYKPSRGRVCTGPDGAAAPVHVLQRPLEDGRRRSAGSPENYRAPFLLYPPSTQLYLF